MDTNIGKEALKYIDTFELDNTVKSKPVLGMDDLLLLLNHHWARDTATFPIEQHQVQFALILLLLFSTGCRPAELVDAKKKRKDNTGFEDDDLNDDNILAVDKSDDGFGAGSNKDFGDRDNDALDSVDATSGVEEDIRHCDAICYKDVHLLGI